LLLHQIPQLLDSHVLLVDAVRQLAALLEDLAFALLGVLGVPHLAEDTVDVVIVVLEPLLRTYGGLLALL